MSEFGDASVVVRLHDDASSDPRGLAFELGSVPIEEEYLRCFIADGYERSLTIVQIGPIDRAALSAT